MLSLLWKTVPGPGPVLVTAGLRGDVAAALGSRVFVFFPKDGEYQPGAGPDLGAAITGLAAGHRGPGQENRGYYAASTSDSIFLLGEINGTLAVMAQYGPEPGASFADLAAGDLDGDKRDEIVAVARELETVYVFSAAEADGEGLRLDLVGIRLVPGAPLFVEVLSVPGFGPAMVVAYEKEGKSGVALYFLTQEGFVAGPVLENLPFRVSGMAAGNFFRSPGPEIALGGGDGMVRIIGAGERLDLLMTTDNLGTSVSSLAAAGEEFPPLLVGTPEGNVFVFNYPAGKSPDLAFSADDGVSGLAPAPENRVAVGTYQGQVQVWFLSGAGGAVEYTVRPGDTLWVISRKFGVPVDRIMAANMNLKNPGVIFPGQVIKVPVR